MGRFLESVYPGNAQHCPRPRGGLAAARGRGRGGPVRFFVRRISASRPGSALRSAARGSWHTAESTRPVLCVVQRVSAHAARGPPARRGTRIAPRAPRRPHTDTDHNVRSPPGKSQEVCPFCEDDGGSRVARPSDFSPR
eukprot:572529-Prymnesium_polylepis.1